MSDKGATIDRAGATMRRKGMQDPILREVWRYWESLRAGRIAPLRRELDPGSIATVLENSFILERAAPGVTRYRLAGLALCDLMGMELRGMPADALIRDSARREYGAALDRVFARGDIAEIRLCQPDLGPDARAEVLVLPMRDDFGRLNRALGAMIASPQALVAAPCRFDITEVGHTRVVTTGADPFAPVAPTGLREAAARFDAPAPRRTPGQLRLVTLAGRRVSEDADED